MGYLTNPTPPSKQPVPDPLSSILESPTASLLLGAGSTTALFTAYWMWARYVKRVPNSDMLGPGRMGGRSMRGVVTSVGDADNFRLFHKPLLSFARVPTTRAGLKDQTIHIRLAGVDAPEMAHFGNPAQPFSTEAFDWLTKQVLGKKVKVDLHSKDRYGRVVGMAYTRPFPWIFRKNVSEEMLKVGLATVYTQAGAIHAGKLKKFEQLEAKARSRKKGMWSDTTIPYESPAEYKKRVAQA